MSIDALITRLVEAVEANTKALEAAAGARAEILKSATAIATGKSTVTAADDEAPKEEPKRGRGRPRKTEEVSDEPPAKKKAAPDSSDMTAADLYQAVQTGEMDVVAALEELASRPKISGEDKESDIAKALAIFRFVEDEEDRKDRTEKAKSVLRHFGVSGFTEIDNNDERREAVGYFLKWAKGEKVKFPVADEDGDDLN